MSRPSYAAVPVGFQQIRPVTFTVTNGTAAKVVQEPLAAAAAGATSPLYYGGCTIIDLTATSTDVVKDVILYEGVVTTTETIATGAMTTTASTITRTNGTFITDGYKVGDNVMIFAPEGTAPNAAVDGILATLTTVVALTLTANGTPFGALTLATGSRVVRVANLFRATVAANSGSSATIPNVKLLGNSQDQSAVLGEKKLGSSDMLMIAMQANVGALPAYLSVAGSVARY
jgi:hypothetical protein